MTNEQTITAQRVIEILGENDVQLIPISENEAMKGTQINLAGEVSDQISVFGDSEAQEKVNPKMAPQFDLRGDLSAQSFMFPPKDDRFVIDHLIQKAPWRSVGNIRCWSDGATPSVFANATGTLIHRNLVLTCSHSIFKRPDGTRYRMSFVPAYDTISQGSQIKQELMPYGEINVTKAATFAWLNPEVKPSGYQGVDFAVLVLDKPIGDTLGVWKTMEFHPDCLKTQWAHIGYPYDKNFKPHGQSSINLFKEEKLDVQHNGAWTRGLVLHTDCDNFSGQSGGPLFVRINNIPYVLGVLHGNVGESNPSGHVPSPAFASGPDMQRLIQEMIKMFG